MNAHIHKSLWTGLYHATLLGGEFANCHGQGPTPEMAKISLKLTDRVRRKWRDQAPDGPIGGTSLNK